MIASPAVQATVGPAQVTNGDRSYPLTLDLLNPATLDQAVLEWVERMRSLPAQTSRRLAQPFHRLRQRNRDERPLQYILQKIGDDLIHSKVRDSQFLGGINMRRVEAGQFKEWVAPKLLRWPAGWYIARMEVSLSLFSTKLTAHYRNRTTVNFDNSIAR